MMPRGSPLARQQLAEACASIGGAEHPHAAQNPVTLDFNSLNRKNARIA